MTTNRVESTVHEIRRVALEMFATRGYDAASIRDIAQSVGIRAATMYHHFASKEEILWDLTASALDELAASWEAARQQVRTDDPLDVLRAFVGANVRFHAERRTSASLVNAQLNRLSAEHFDRAVVRRHAYEQELTTIVRTCVATGNHHVVDVRLTVFAILQMTNAVSTWYQPDGVWSVEHVAKVYEHLAVKMLAQRPTGLCED